MEWRIKGRAECIYEWTDEQTERRKHWRTDARICRRAAAWTDAYAVARNGRMDSLTHEQTDKRRDRRKRGRIEGRTDGRRGGKTVIQTWTMKDGWTGIHTYRRIEWEIDRRTGRGTDRPIDGRMHSRTGGGGLADSREDKWQKDEQACVQTDGHSLSEQRDWGLEGQIGLKDIQAETDRHTGVVTDLIGWYDIFPTIYNK